MRLVLAMALALTGGTAFASSITAVGGHPASQSVLTPACPQCVAIPQKAEEPSYRVPELAPGTQKTEIIDINGVKKLARTEAWLGGSPVVHVSKIPEGMMQEDAVAEIHPQADGSTEKMIEAVETSTDGVDTDATTGTIGTLVATAPAAASASTAPVPLDLESFQLRTR